MARRILPSAAMRSFLESVSGPPATNAGGLLTPSPAPPTPPTPPPASPASTTTVASLPADQALVGCLLGVILMLVVIVLVLVIATATAYAQNVCAPKPPGEVCETTQIVPSGTSSTPPAIEWTAQAPVLSSRPPPPTSHEPIDEPPSILLALALLLGVGIGRGNTRPPPNMPAALGAFAPADSEAMDLAQHYLGAASITGPVRETNQDRVAVARIADLDVIVVADGLGGLPRGGEAAELVVSYAMRRLKVELPMVVTAREEGVRALLMNIIWGAGVELACTAARDTWRREEEGLRTTLILVVASTDLYVTAWIGDGGVFIVRDDYATNMIEPHKNLATPDLLTASLGPRIEGRPGWAMARRHSREVLAVATDGIADVFNNVCVHVVEAVDDADGDAERGATNFVERLATLTNDAEEPLLTDNLTLAVLFTPGDPS